ncbi:MAG: Gfo/Idh/MocA family oxidoreductase [Thermomicrobiales bacterium]
MKRIGIVGSDNSHAIAYSKLINKAKIVGDEASVVGIWGQDRTRTEEVAGLGEIPKIYDTFDGMVPDVDIVFVVDRHGDLHAPHVLPYLEAGIDAYVDKPIAISLADVRAMIAAAAKSGSFLTSMSSLRVAPDTDRLADQIATIGEVRAAQFAGPCDFESEYGGPFFYATHVAETALRLLGDEIESLAAHRTGGTVVIDAAWSGGRQATFTYLTGAAYYFGATFFGSKGVATGTIAVDDSGYAEIVKDLLAAIDSGQRPLTDDQLLTPIAIVRAIQQSLENNGSRVSIADVVTGS